MSYFREICRVCMRSGQELIHIFDEKYSDVSPGIAAMLGECTKYEVFRFDALPHQICYSCLKAVKSAYLFKQNCEKSYRYLMQILSESKSGKRLCFDKNIIEECSSHVKKTKKEESLHDEKNELHYENSELNRKKNLVNYEKSELTPCGRCDKTFFNIGALGAHLAIAHKGSPIPCQFCSKKFTRIDYLKSHIAIHHPVSGYQSHKQHLKKVHKFESFGDEQEKTNTESTKFDIDESDNELSDTFEIIKEEYDIMEDTHINNIDPLHKVFINENLKEQTLDLNDLKEEDIIGKINNETYESNFVSEESENESEVFNEQIESGQEEWEFNQQETMLNEEKRTLYPCERCDKKFIDIRGLRAHRASDHKGSPIVCRYCSKKCTRVGYLKSHMAIHHPESGYISSSQCHICKRQFPRRLNLLQHMKNIHPDDIPKPEYTKPTQEYHINDDANISFNEPLHTVLIKNNSEIISMEEGELEKDNSISEGVDENTNDEDSSSVSKESQKVSAKHQKGNELQPCERCEKKFFDIAELRVHRSTAHKGSPIVCRFCSKKYDRIGYLRSHMAICHPDSGYKSRIQCHTCNRQFLRRQDLIHHIQKVHEEIDVLRPENYEETEDVNRISEESYLLSKRRRKSTTSTKLKYSCKECEKSYSNERQYKIHWNEMHNPTKIYNFNCKECSQNFNSRKKLYDHKMAVGHCTLLCPQCGLRCISNSALTVHMRRHTGEKPYKCKFCNKGFHGPDDLHRHEIHHTEEKNYFCETCGKSFYSKKNLNVHIRVHTGEKPYKCPHCPQAFAQQQYLTIHIRLHTGERLICEYCDQAFIQLNQLRQHKLTEHGIDEGPTTNRVSKFPSLQSQQQQIQLIKEYQ